MALLARLPQGLLSRCTGWIAERRLPRPLRRPVIGAFARAVGADLTEAEREPREYPSVSAFFTRRLRPGVRDWPADPAVPASPVDGIVGQVGRVQAGRALQAKGVDYGVGALLADPSAAGAFESAEEAFGGGWFVTLYLSPRHYHRIHAPVGGVVREARAVPGALLPVNDAAVRLVPGLFPRNERLVALIDAGGGHAGEGRSGGEGHAVAVVAVGAFNVGRISAAFDPEWGRPGGRGVTNRGRSTGLELRRYDPPVPVTRGQELMAFHLGSTVVLLFGPGHPERTLHPSLVPGREIRLGAPLFR